MLAKRPGIVWRGPRREASKHVRKEGRDERWASSKGGQPGHDHRVNLIIAFCYPQRSMTEAVVCASCPETYHDRVAVRAIKTEMASQAFRVRVELIEIHEFLERYPDVTSKTSKSTKPKYGKGGKDTQDGKGKDHHSSLPSRSRPQQAKFIRSDHRSRSRSRTATPRTPPPNTVYANSIGTPPLPAPPYRAPLPSFRYDPPCLG